MTLSEKLNALLPQTQCRECGFSGCLPYAQALAEKKAASNLCVVGKEEVARDLAHCLSQPVLLPEKTHQHRLAVIEENACIGCAACIRVCPVDAILGATKQMHTVISDECTGCALCVESCPVDCIHLLAVDDLYLPRARTRSGSLKNERFAAAKHAKARFDERNARTEQQKIAPKNTARKAAQSQATHHADLIAQAMARAQAQQNQRITTHNSETFRQNQLKQAQARSLYRRYQRDVQYGNEEEKAAALEWLRQYKAMEEEKASPEKSV